MKRRSRRAFLRLLAAGSLAGLAAPAQAPVRAAAAAAAPARRRRLPPPPNPPSRSAHEREEIRKQKEYLAASLKTIRDYPLPPGSEPAFAFSALPPSPPSRVRRSPARPLPREGGDSR